MKTTARQLTLSLIVVALASIAHAQSFEVKTHTLKNGMKILVQEDHTIPNVALYVFYRIGSRNEHPGTTGLSHFFEHMMFNGAKKYGPGEFDRVMEGAGGSNNAYTTQDVTVYQDWFPRSALGTIFDLEADRIENLSFDPKMISSERGVVASERRTSVDANNFGILNEQLWATAFTAHTYQWPVVGWMVDIENWAMDDLKHHFEMGYSPSNATLVVVGDISADEIVQLAEKKIEPIASHAPPPKVTTREPEQLGERRVTVKKFAQLPIVMIGYHVPEAASPEYYALDLLDTILLFGQSSRMYQRIVDKDQLAISVGGGARISFDPTLFTITAQPKAGIDPQAVEKAVYEELDRVKKDLVTDQELQKAKNIALATFYRQMDTINGRANTLGTYEVFFGDYHKLFNAVDSYNRVTKEDIQKIAQKYFNEKNRTVATLIPDKEDKEEAGKQQANQE
ncbi:MAG TPA: pitrilysin family protein [Candidatus Angelobacter sp.]|jgi:zinc protease|nr:pitrilysin family protein [Candidatus Angelobacter sp.]